ncbi:MAG TPA: efflux RND transporter periplasmic adaptor subunit, partial [Candidatus Polarisedimenticolia bacterium]|nr:efflux RND transporter periplasmic adaptor subunit [Candidatus Polarisedimenticolia bacterium]
MSPLDRRRLALIVLGLLALSLAIVAAVLLTKENRPAGGAATEAAAATYHCPMHPTMVSDRPGDCPICQMRMVPIEAPAGAGPSPRSSPAPTPRRVIYRSTMNPSEISDRPGKDSMGMEMERVEIDEEGPDAVEVEGLAAVRIPLHKQQLIGVRTTLVKRAPFIRTIRAVGRVTVDETRIHHVHAKTEGWVETLAVDTTGVKVTRGEPLLSLYSPDLLATQGEYLLALKARRELTEGALSEAERRADQLIESSRRRLLLLDFNADQIAALEASGAPSRAVTLYAPVSGYVLQRNVSHGEKITPDMNLLDIADLSRVWVIASVYEYELPFVRPGQPATISLTYLPGQTFQGRVSLVYPVLEGATRTAQVRLEFPNPRLDLKPEMYAEVALQSDLGPRLAVPESAILATGTRNVVFVLRGEGYFEPREVRLGLRLPGTAEVLEGLTEGEAVVTSGNFLIDSESKMKGADESAPAAPWIPAPAPEGRGAPTP